MTTSRTSRFLAASGALLWVALLTGAQSARPQGTRATPEHDYPIQPVPFTAVHLHDVFCSACIGTHRHLHSLPTRRSSDLLPRGRGGSAVGRPAQRRPEHVV